MPCQLFGPFDPRNDPPSDLQKWMQSCPTAGGPYPRAHLNPDGTYALYCCSAPGDLPPASRVGVTIDLSPEAVMELLKTGRLPVDGEAGSIRVTPLKQQRQDKA